LLSRRRSYSGDSAAGDDALRARTFKTVLADGGPVDIEVPRDRHWL